jgi:SH3-like domain-containing protein
LIDSQRLLDFIEEVKKEYDLVIFDSPPVLSTADSTILGAKVDAVILVYRVGSISRGLLKRTTVQLQQLKSNLLGVVLNGMKPEVSPDFMELKYYKYYYSYGEEGEKKKRVKAERHTEGRKLSPVKIWLLIAALALLVLGVLWQMGILPVDRYLFGVSRVETPGAMKHKQPVEVASTGGSIPLVVFGGAEGESRGGDAVKSTSPQKKAQAGLVPIEKGAVSREADLSASPSGEGDGPARPPRASAAVARESDSGGRRSEGRLLPVLVPVGNLRSRPSIESPKVGVLKGGAEVAIIARRGEWLIVRVAEDRVAWAHRSLFAEAGNLSDLKSPSEFHPEAERQVVLRVEMGRVREKPSLDSGIRLGLSKGEAVTIHQEKGDWFLVEREDGGLGWAHQSLFLQEDPVAESPSF